MSGLQLAERRWMLMVAGERYRLLRELSAAIRAKEFRDWDGYPFIALAAIQHFAALPTGLQAVLNAANTEGGFSVAAAAAIHNMQARAKKK